MGTNRVTEYTYRNYRRKRNSLLFFLFVPSSIILISFIYLYTEKIFIIDTLVTIYLPLVIANLVMIFLIQPKLTLYSMYCDHTSLIEGHHEPLHTSKKLFTTSWINDFKNDGFIVSQEHQTHILLYKYYKKLEGIPGSDSTIVFVVIAKQKSFNFYCDEIDQGIQAVYMNNKLFQKSTKQIVLQFKKYDQLDKATKEEIEAAILFKSGKQRIINLTAGYFENTQTVYSMCSLDKYPNKYIFYAAQEIRKYSYLKE